MTYSVLKVPLNPNQPTNHRARTPLNATARNARLHWSSSLATKQPRPESSGL